MAAPVPVARGKSVHVSRSGRRSRPLSRTLLSNLLAAAVLIALVLVALSLYTPLLHVLLDDGIVRFAALDKKLVQDQWGALINHLAHREVRPESPLPTIRLHVDPGVFASLNQGIVDFGLGRLPAKPRVRAMSELPDGKLQRVKIAYRGANSWHHQAWKPSLRVRYKRQSLVDGYRNHVLVAPEDPPGLRNWLSIELARRLGMLTYDEHFVRLFVNDRYFGLYTRTWRYDESLLIHHDLLPGPFFRLEAGSGAFQNRHAARWDDPATWEVKGGETEAAGREALARMIAVVAAPPSVARQEAINQLFDRDAFAAWLTVLCHASEVHVHDHNIAFWLDTTSGQLVPLPTDVNGYDWSHPGNAERAVTRAISPLVRAWLADPRNLAHYIDQLATLLAGTGSTPATEAIVREQWQTVRPDALADERTSEMGSRIGSYTRTFFPVTRLDANVDELVEFIGGRNRFIADRLARAAVTVVEEAPDTFTVRVDGLAGVRAVRHDGSAFRVADRAPATEAVLLTSLGQATGGDPAFENTFAFHTLPGKPADYDFLHRLDGRPVPLATAPPDERPARWRAAVGLDPAAFPVAAPQDLTFGPGEVRWLADRTFPATTSVRLEPGTTLRLGPGVSVVFHGRLTVAGSAAAPVRIRAADPARTFGGVALVGAATEESVIRHLDIEGGATHRRHNLAFTGPFSVHDCPDVLIEDSRFRANFDGDDLLHIARSRAVMRRSTFEDARYDAVDWDRVDGLVEDCTFRRSGNDGLDLSLGMVTIRNSLFEDAGDKLVSVGEGAKVRLESCRLHRGTFGVAVKDRAEVQATDLHLAGCEVAWGTYRKKWRWERGGISHLTACRFAGSRRADIEGDGVSRVIFHGARPPGLTVRGKVEVEVEADATPESG